MLSSQRCINILNVNLSFIFQKILEERRCCYDATPNPCIVVNSVGSVLKTTTSTAGFYGGGHNERVMAGSPITSVRLT